MYAKYHKEIKLALAGILLALAIWQFTQGNIGNGIFLILLISLPVLLIFRNEYLLLAFWHLRKQNFDKAEGAVLKITYPEKLINSQEAYYNFLMGTMEVRRSLTRSEKYFRKALSLGLSMDYNAAIAKMNLAMIAMNKRRKLEAQTLINEAKKLDKYNMLTDQIKQIKDGLKRI